MVWTLRRLCRSVMLRAVLRCEECRCFSDIGKGWLAFIAEDPDDGEGPEVATYCPPCADRELRPVDHGGRLRLIVPVAAVSCAQAPGWRHANADYSRRAASAPRKTALRNTPEPWGRRS